MKPRIAIASIGPLSSLRIPNFGLLYIINYLQKKLNINLEDILFIDQCAGDNVLKILDCEEWEILGLSSSSISAHQLNIIGPEIKKRWPKRLVILGGVHVTAMPKIALKQSQANFGIIGEGEISFADLLLAFYHLGYVPKNIPGLVWLDGEELRFSSKQIERIENLDIVSELPLDILKNNFYFKKFDPIPGTNILSFPWITSRGCPYNCRFCCANLTCGGKVRFHSADRVLNDMEMLIQKYRVPSINFIDDLFLANRLRAIDICKGILSKPTLRGLKWRCLGRANLIDKELASLLKKAGCIQIAFGFESGSQKILRYLKRDTLVVEDNIRAIKICKKEGLPVHGFFMFGSPGETKEDIMQTIAFIHNNPIDFISIFTTQPWPGSELWDLALDRQIINLDTIDWRNIAYDKKPLLADSVNLSWLNRRFIIEMFRAALHNYSLPIFFLRFAKAFHWWIKQNICARQ